MQRFAETRFSLLVRVGGRREVKLLLGVKFTYHDGRCFRADEEVAVVLQPGRLGAGGWGA